MKLPFFNSNNKKENYIGIYLQEDKAVGYIYEVSDNGIAILAQHSHNFSNGYENIIEDIDDILFRLETDTNKKLKKTIFFVSSQYINAETKEIKKEYKIIIKNIVKELDLEALGFIESYEAVASSLKTRNQSVNSIIIELEKSKGNIYVYNNNELSLTTSFDRDDDLTHEITNSLKEIENNVLPPHMLLFPFTESHKQMVHLVNHKWAESLFAQQPKIEVLLEDIHNQGLAEIFFNQVKPNTEIDEVVVATPPVIENNQSEEILGFAIGQDVAENNAEAIVEPINAVKSDEIHDTYDEEQQIPIKKGKLGFNLAEKFAGLSSITHKKPLALILIPLIIILIGISLLGSEYFLHKVTLEVTFPSKSLEDSITISNSDLDIKSGNITVDVTSSTATTGKRDIGEEAKGEMTLHNFDDAEKTITKGTELKTDNKVFVLDQDVKIAPASEIVVSGVGNVKQPGKVKASVTAAEIGPEGNIEKGKKFSIGALSTSDYYAINDEALSGGSKRQARTVAKKDTDDLEKKVLADGKKKGLEQLKTNTSSDQKIIDSLTEQDLEDITFSKEVGDEATEVDVDAKVATTYFTYSEQDLKKAVMDSLKSDVESGYYLPMENIKVSIENAEKNDSDIELTVNATAESVKQVPIQQIKEMVSGKSTSNLDQVLKQDLEAKNYLVTTNFLNFFPFSSRMPLFKKNIEIKINSL